ncbi:MAG: helix-turn-helix transcriptional regulator [Gammaproteobacteria bacterium]|nr:helix-turn-helix transcriptional regulator [Gammaproteobacteria bacterium]
MPKAVELVDALKREMRARRITYRDLATKLGLSEGAVKRMFALNRMTLGRVDAICDILKVDLAELVEKHAREEQRLDQLTEAQERQLVQDPKRLLVAACVLNRWSFEEILDIYALAPTDCIRHLAALDKIRFIELLPGNRYRIKVSDSFRWRPGGPIERFFENLIADEFLAGDFRDAGRSRVFLHGFLSERGRDDLVAAVERVAVTFRDLLKRDRGVPAAQRQHVGFLIAFRPWNFSIYDDIRRRGPRAPSRALRQPPRS